MPEFATLGEVLCMGGSPHKWSYHHEAMRLTCINCGRQVNPLTHIAQVDDALAASQQTVATLQERVLELERPSAPQSLDDAVALVRRAMACLDVIPDGIYPPWDAGITEAYNHLDDEMFPFRGPESPA